MVMNLGDNLIWIILAVVVLALVAFLLLRPRQRVRLGDDAPLRPHMAQSREHRGEGDDIASEAAAAVSDVTGEILDAPVHSYLAGAGGPADDLQKLKGVGPKFGQMLNDRGIVSYEQLARLTAAEIELLDSQLGPFRGRLKRDRITEQADYLARGDTDGFQARFGSLST
jgi:predicted flap endonuclease-1-like 5' DNA nuclease